VPGQSVTDAYIWQTYEIWCCATYGHSDPVAPTPRAMARYSVWLAVRTEGEKEWHQWLVDHTDYAPFKGERLAVISSVREHLSGC